MKVVILAGGYGTRISEESHLKPKPMIEIGEYPILWHIMKMYSHFGFNEFIICLGYKGHMIKEYFADYYMLMSDVTFDFRDGNQNIIHKSIAEPWSVTLVNTGLDTMTGGRIKRIQSYVGDETFLLTYGDGVSDVDIPAVVEQHRQSGAVCTLTGVQLDGRFGSLSLTEDDHVTGFAEKPKGDGTWVNGGFMVIEPEIFNYLDGDSSILEQEPLEILAHEGKLACYRHEGFWRPMDTLRDKQALDHLWSEGNAPWKIW